MNYATQAGQTAAQGVSGDALGRMRDVPTQPIQMTPLLEAMAKHSALIDALAPRLVQLEERLSGVLRPATPVPGADGKTAERQLVSPFAEAMENENERLQFIHRHIESLLNRLEL